MRTHLKLFLLLTCFLTACQTSSDFGQFDVNTVDLTKITGEGGYSPSFFDSALWSAALGAALLAAISSSKSTYKDSNMDPNALDSEWIE
jgi:hypothetical protein